jgi:hypothetical protein
MLWCAPLRGSTLIAGPSAGFFFPGQSIDLVDFIGNACFGPCGIEQFNETNSIAFGSLASHDLSTLQYTLTSYSNYGRLGDGLSAVMRGEAGSPVGFLGVYSVWDDNLTIIDTTRTGGNGTATFNFVVEGSDAGINGSPGAYAIPKVNYYFGPSSGAATGEVSIDLPTANTTLIQPVTVKMPFVFGQSFEFEGFLESAIQFGCSGGSCTTFFAAGNVDFSHTSLLTGIQIVDANGSPVTNFSIESDSGTVYTATGVATPEPATVLMLSTGLFFVWRRSRASRTLR